MSYLFSPPAPPSAAIAGESFLFPVHRIYCVGKNYAAHVREMGGSPEREPPCFFLKPADAVVNGSELQYPPRCRDFHYEAELVIAIGRAGADIPPGQALEHVYGYAIGLDMTRRDLQSAAIQLGQPWDTGKAFDHSAPLSPIQAAARCGHPNSGRIQLLRNGELRQDADLSELIWKTHEIIAELSTYYRLCAGDLIFTGTPAGVGSVERGDELEARIEGLGQLQVKVV